MRYECPKCGDNRKPMIINYFPPVIVQCYNCEQKNIEAEFVIKEEQRFILINHA